MANSDIAVTYDFTAGSETSDWLEAGAGRYPGSSVGRDFVTVAVDADPSAGNLVLETRLVDQVNDETIIVETGDTISAKGVYQYRRNSLIDFRIKSSSDFAGTVKVIIHSGATGQ